MACFPRTLQDLSPEDAHVLWDLTRFGVLADYQIDRIYGNRAITSVRLPALLEEEFIQPIAQPFSDVECFEITHRGYCASRFGLTLHRVQPGHIGHDLALVDLAHHLKRRLPTADWRTEQQVSRALDLLAGKRQKSRNPHSREFERRPDGLLVDGDRRIAVELEHSIKSVTSYSRICNWYAFETRITELWWFTDDPAIEARIRDVNSEFGFEGDITIRYESFPDGVFVRQWSRLR